MTATPGIVLPTDFYDLVFACISLKLDIPPAPIPATPFSLGRVSFAQMGSVSGIKGLIPAAICDLIRNCGTLVPYKK